MSQSELIPTQLDAYNLIHEGILAFSRAEQVGLRVDIEYCQKEKHKLTKRAKRIQDRLEQTDFIHRWEKATKGKFNINSNSQLGYILYDVEGITPPKYTMTGKGATDEESLVQIDKPELQKILELRKLKKIRDTYLDTFEREAVNGYIHPFFNLHTARTYRSSSDHPNFQNIPKRDEQAMNICRRALFPRPGHQLLEVDFGALEVAIAVCYHQDSTMITYLTDPDSDMHGDLARQIFILDEYENQIKQAGGLKKISELKTLRDAAKNGFVFPQFYGDYYGNNANDLACKWGDLPKGKWKKGQGIMMPDGNRLSDHFIKNKIKSYDDFIEHVKKIEEDFWGHRFPQYQKWKEEWVKKYQKKGYFDMLTGFRCKGVMRKNEVINYPVQGSAFHCLLWSFIEIDKILRNQGFESRLVSQIHDSMILDIHPNELEHVAQTIRCIACVELPKAWPWIVVPLDVEMDLCPVDGSWNMKEGYELPEI